MEAGNNIIAFMKSIGYIRLETNTSATSKNLYQAYCRWCEDNAEKPMGAKSFSGYLKENEKKYNIRYSTNIPSDNGKSARGFQESIHRYGQMDSDNRVKKRRKANCWFKRICVYLFETEAIFLMEVYVIYVYTLIRVN